MNTNKYIKSFLRPRTIDNSKRPDKIERRGRVVYQYTWINGAYKLSKVTCMVLMMLMLSGNVHASQINDTKAIKTIIGEEENNFEGMLYVASTIRNRGKLQGAYGLHSPRVVKHLYSVKSYNDAKRAWILSEKLNYHCCNWFSDQDLKQAKVQRIIHKDHLILVKRIGNKRFGNNFFRRG